MKVVLNEGRRGGELQAEADIQFKCSFGCPHILAAAGTCTGYIAEEGALMLVLEWHQLTLAQVLDASRIPISRGDSELARSRMRWLSGVASGLAHLHQLGVR